MQKIAEYDPQFGFTLEGSEEILLWQKFVCFQRGISPAEFRRSRSADIQDVTDILAATTEKGLRQDQLNAMIAQVASGR